MKLWLSIFILVDGEKLIVTYSNNNVLLLMHIWTNIAYLNIYACRFLHNYNTQVVIFAWEEIMHKLFWDVYLHILHLQLFEFILNRPFTLSRFDSKIIQFFIRVISLMEGKMVPIRASERTENLNIIFV
jgi:ABC-type multidrug transport system fused ATPase/permease subunit